MIAEAAPDLRCSPTRPARAPPPLPIACGPVAETRPDEIPPTPLAAIVMVTVVASLGTGVLWNGMAFIAESAYGYGKVANFGLSAVYGLAYVGAAFGSGALTRRLEEHLSPRGILALVFLLQALASPLVLLPVGSWSLWVVGGLASALSAIQWPIIESYLGAGRHRAAMRSAIGWWNLAWMSAVALSLIALQPLLDGNLARWAVVGLLPTNVICILGLRGFTARPASHPSDPSDPVPETYRQQLRSARSLLPAGYVVVGAISPLLPYLLGSLAAPSSLRTPLAATWLLSRVVAVAILASTKGWHGRWSTLVVAAVLMAAGFAATVLAPALPVLALGLVAFGLGQGITYYAAIYYALAVGHSEIDAAGVHEGLIGVGYAMGPLAGLAAFGMRSDLGAANVLFVVLIWSMLAVFYIPATRNALRRPVNAG